MTADPKAGTHSCTAFRRSWMPSVPAKSSVGSTSAMRLILKHLSPGVSEIFLHLGSADRQTNYPGGLDLGCFPSREAELATVTDPEIRRSFEELNVIPVGYHDLERLGR